MSMNVKGDGSESTHYCSRLQQAKLLVTRALRSLYAPVLEQARVDRVEEPARLHFPLAALDHPLACMADEQTVLCPGQADEEEPPLLGDVVVGGRSTPEAHRQQGVLAADQ